MCIRDSSYTSALRDVYKRQAISSAQRRMRAAKKVGRKKLTSGPALPGKLEMCIRDS
ncbi:hypothetical protein [Erwinia amylovora]